jgi:hypothetical protein
MREYRIEKTAADMDLQQVSSPTAKRVVPSGHSVLQLQRSIGNQYVQRLLALARKGDGEAEVDPAVELAISRARGSGQSLDSEVRLQMEQLFGANFGGVRVHTGSEADSLNRSLNAIAFTTGQDIFFREPAYSPGSPAGKELLAHELTHVVQQGSSSVQGKLVLGAADDAYEKEADFVAKEVVEGLHQSTESPVQRCACGGNAASGGECAECQQEREASAQRNQFGGI